MTELTKDISEQLYTKHNDPKGSFYQRNGSPIDPLFYPKRIYQLGGTKQDVEIAGIIASYLAYGERKQFIKKINAIFKDIFNSEMDFNDNNMQFYKHRMGEGDYTLYNFIKYRRYLHYRPNGSLDPCFYRMYKLSYLFQLFEKLREIYLKYDSLEDAVNDCQITEVCDTRSRRELLLSGEQPKTRLIAPYKRLAYLFDSVPMFGKITLKYSSKQSDTTMTRSGELKKVNMFMRWMVRKDNNDLGLWTSIKPDELIIPLDTHVAKEAKRYGIINTGYGVKAAERITAYFKEFFPDDPVKGDFVLFGEAMDRYNADNV